MKAIRKQKQFEGDEHHQNSTKMEYFQLGQNLLWQGFTAGFTTIIAVNK